VKVFNARTGELLSGPYIEKSSLRLAGWSSDKAVLFPYNSEVTVYEGDWEHQYEARFELWFRGATAKQRKLLEKKLMIYGWER
jgi:hypothetical protein